MPCIDKEDISIQYNVCFFSELLTEYSLLADYIHSSGNVKVFDVLLRGTSKELTLLLCLVLQPQDALPSTSCIWINYTTKAMASVTDYILKRHPASDVLQIACYPIFSSLYCQLAGRGAVCILQHDCQSAIRHSLNVAAFYSHLSTSLAINQWR